MRIFIHNVDTHLGRALVEELRKADGGFHRAFGTVVKSADGAPKAVKRILSRDDPKKAKKMIETIQSCKLVVIDLFNSTLEDLRFVIKALKVDPMSSPPKPTGDLDGDVTFVLISSAFVWAATQVDAEDRVLRESDYARRTPAPGSTYEQWKEMEELVFSCFNREESRVKALVVAGGIMYGEDGGKLAPIFKDAWCGVQAHTIVGDGKNRIPMVHVRDLARLVRHIGDNADINAAETPYFLAVDQPPADQEGAPSLPPTQAELVQGIVDELCDPYEVPHVQEWPDPPDGLDEAELTALRDLQDTMSLDLVMEPSKHMLAPEFAAINDPPGWYCREGLLKNVRKISDEFCNKRELKAMRVLIAGPPASGKSTLAKNVSEHFKIPQLELHEEDYLNIVDTLSQRVCRYRGFVLDVGHLGFTEMEKLFRFDIEVPPDEDDAEPPPPADEEDEEGGSKAAAPKTARMLNEEICPSFVVVLQAPKGLCQGRWLQAKGKGTDAEFHHVWAQYSSANLSENHCLADFFQEIVKCSVFNIPVAGKDEEDIFESTRIYMEREGRPFNYLPTSDEVAAQILERLAAKELAEAEEASKAAHTDDPATAQQGEATRHAERLRVLARHEKEQKELRELPLREYLMRYMIPSLTEGLIDVCKVLPENPADYLANYLEQQAADLAAGRAAVDTTP